MGGGVAAWRGGEGRSDWYEFLRILTENLGVAKEGWYCKKKLRSLEKKNHVPWKKYLQPLEKKFRLLWPCGPLVVCSFGPLVLWFFGPLVLWSCGSLVLCSCSALLLWSQKFYELRANHVACFANAFGGEAPRPPPQPPSSQVQVECLNFFSRVWIFFPGVSGGETLKFVFQGL